MHKPEFPLKTFKDTYLIPQDPIGEGAFGKVFCARNSKGRKVAIKVLKRKTLDEELLVTIGSIGGEIGSEIKALTMFNGDPHIVSIHDYAVVGSNAVIVMEYCSDGTLEELLEDEDRLSEYESVKFLCEIAKGLSTIHSQRIMHRDLKPANILLKDGSCKIGDLGLATRKIKAREFAGTVNYAAPEARLCYEKPSESHSYNMRADIFSLGQILLFMLLGQDPPFDPKDIASLNLSSSLASLLAGMLNTDPKQRLSAQEISEISAELIKSGKLKTKISKVTESSRSEVPKTKHSPSTIIHAPLERPAGKEWKASIKTITKSELEASLKSFLEGSGIPCRYCGKANHHANPCPGTVGYETDVICYHCSEPGHIRPNCPRLRGHPSGNPGMQCHACGKFGHYANQCPVTGGYVADVECYDCGRYGHYAPQCPSRY